MLALRVRSITNEAKGINAYELVHPAGASLPGFEPGAHIDVHIDGRYVRQYSLCNAPHERHRYVIGVLNVSDGRGGSAALHATVREGDTLSVSVPRNNFRLASNARRHLMIAGGIGITPMLSMIEALQSAGDDFTLHYCTREPARTAFRQRLEPWVRQGRVIHHYDNGDPSRGLSLTGLLQDREAGTHLYYCGPSGMMSAVARAAAHWPAETVHCEHFGAPPVASASKAADADFRVRIASTGQTLAVPAGRTIIDVLREAGVACETSCEAGVCGTCKTRYLEGTPDHCDFVLDDADRERYVIPCCSRSKSELLVLDL